MNSRTQLILVFIFLSACAIANPMDSLRLELKNGKKYIIHRVAAKESVQSLASYYQVEELAIMEANPLITEGVKKGMVIRVPLSADKYGNVEVKSVSPSFTVSSTTAKKESMAPKPTENKPTPSNQTPKPEVKQEPVVINQTPAGVMPGKILKESTKDGVRKIFYKVGNGETLQSIAQKFNTTDKAIASTNMITSGSVSGGQIIKIEFDEKQASIGEAPRVEPKTTVQPAKTTVKEAAKETYTEAKSAVKELVKKEDKPTEQKAEEVSSENHQEGTFIVKTIHNKKYIMHTTQSDNETIELLADRYSVPIRKIREANNMGADKFRYKQLVKIPVTDELLAKLNGGNKSSSSFVNQNSNKKDTKTVAASNPAKSNENVSTINDSNRFAWGDKIHLKDEDLSALKKKSAQETRDMILNDVHANGGGNTEDEFSHPVQKGETIESIAKKYNITTSDIANWNGLWEYRVREGMELIVNAKRARKPYYALNSVSAEQVKTIKAHDKTSLVEDINEKGLCLFIDDIKFKGILHKTAPVGTLIMIENADNFKKRFYTTTGILRDTNNADVIIQIDEKTANELDINNPLTNIKLRFGIVQ